MKRKHRIVVCDTEWNRLENPDTLWIIVCRDVNDPDSLFIFERPDLNPKEFLDFAKEVAIWIGHNFLEFDLPNLSSLLPSLDINPRNVIDTLVVSRTLNFKIEGGHSLEAWGLRLNLPVSKIQIKDFSVYTEDLKERCIADTVINLKTFEYLKKYIENPIFTSALRTEHELSILCRILRSNGFYFDKDSAGALKRELEERLTAIDLELKTAFPPKRILIDKIKPRLTKTGSIYATDIRRLNHFGFGIPPNVLDPGVEYELWEEQEFDPGSLKQCIERLNDAGWNPIEKTKGHAEFSKGTRRYSNPLSEDDAKRGQRFDEFGWKLSEVNLRTLPESAPKAAQRLVERLLLASRISDLDEWLALVQPDNRIHGQFFHIGSWTHRMSTSKPNMQNIPVAKHSDKETELDRLSNSINDMMRSLWTCPKGRRIVGVDADGIQMRVFGHVSEEQALIDALVKGKKEDGTDIHSVNRRALGGVCQSRDDAKTFIYAWLLGAGAAKVAEILRCSVSEAKRAIDSFIAAFPGLRRLKEGRIPSDAKRGYFEGLDNRLVVCDNEHLVLAGYLQNGEKVIMARGAVWWNQVLRAEDPVLFKHIKWINFVHDEWQTEIPDDDDIAKYITGLQAKSIVIQGDELNMRCPLAASVSKTKDGFIGGYSWKDTH